MASILIIRPSSLGDIVHALSVVADVRAARPELAIDWVAEEAFASLVELHPGVRRTIPVALRRWRHHLLAGASWHEFAAFRRELARERYHAVIDLQEQFKGAVLAALARGERHGPDRASTGEPLATLLHDVHHAIPYRQHFQDRCRQLVAATLGYAVAGPPRFGLIAPAPALEVAGASGRYAVLVHGSSRDDKLWPEPSWRALAVCFAQAGIASLLPWGNDAERERAGRIAVGLAAAHVLPRSTLPALAGLLRRAEVVVGVDTGLVHLAAALGTPTTAIFVATDPGQAGVERAGSNARDLGGVGRVPTAGEVEAATGALLRAAPRC